MPAEAQTVAVDSDLDHRGRSWYVDKAVQALVFTGGVSALVFILGIFVFISREGFTFVFGELSFIEFFTSIEWRPTSLNDPQYNRGKGRPATACAKILTQADTPEPQ